MLELVKLEIHLGINLLLILFMHQLVLEETILLGMKVMLMENIIVTQSGVQQERICQQFIGIGIDKADQH